MRVIGVIDLLGGKAVHARAGERHRYAPVEQVAGTAIKPGDAVAVATLYLEQFGISELYVADLDSIRGHAPQRALTSEISALGAPVWLDAGISSDASARAALQSGATMVVVGLETLTSFDALASICTMAGPRRVAFSLDLRDNQPIAPRLADSDGLTPERLAARAIASGAGAIVVIDLVRVGMFSGLDTRLLERVRPVMPGATLVAGGGVRGFDDLTALANAGCDGALVATALQRMPARGRGLSAADVANARLLPAHHGRVTR